MDGNSVQSVCQYTIVVYLFSFECIWLHKFLYNNSWYSNNSCTSILSPPFNPSLTSNPDWCGLLAVCDHASSSSSLGIPSCSTPSTTPRMNLNSSMQVPQSYHSIQLLGLEMLLHWLVGPEITVTAARENLQLSLGKHTLQYMSFENWYCLWALRSGSNFKVCIRLAYNISHNIILIIRLMNL